MKPTCERVHELLNYDGETGIVRWKVNRGPARINARAGYEQPSGYRVIGLDLREYYEHQLIWFMKTGVWSDQIDHWNVKRNDNRWLNLREITTRNNTRNRSLVNGKRGRNKSGVIGVYRNSKNDKWIAEIRNDDRNIYLGSFDELAEAAAVRRQAEIELWSAS